MSLAKQVFGIDLGTTYSCIAHVDEYGKPVVIANSEGQSTTPSVVYFETEDNTVVGQTAKDVAKVYEDRVVQTVKRAMGDPNWEFAAFDQTYKPQEISAFILRKIVGDAEAELGVEIENVVITCPAYFGTTEKEATKQAGIVAGLNVHYVIPEPTAAAIAYGMALDRDQVVLVFDLGGGTFDVTVIGVREGGIEVISTGGEKELGGKDWDDAIVTYFAQQFETDTGIPADTLLADMQSYQELLLDAERCKITLSSRNTVTQRVRFGGDSATVELTRDQFDSMTSHLVERTLSLTREVIARAADKGVGEIDTVLLVGGSSYVPQVYERVNAEFPGIVQRSDPNQIVAKGAALFGYKCQLDEEIRIRVAENTGTATSDIEAVSEETRDQAVREVAAAHGLALPGIKRLVDATIANVTSKSFGIKVIGPDGSEGINNLVLIDDPIPRTISRTFGTYEEGQNNVALVVFENQDRQGEEAMVDPTECTEIGTAELTFLRPLPKASPVEVVFELTPDGLLLLHGRDATTNQEIRAEFRTDSVMTAEELTTAAGRNLSMNVS